MFTPYIFKAINWVLPFISGLALGCSQIFWHRKALLVLGAGVHTHLIVSVTVIISMGMGALTTKNFLSRAARGLFFTECATVLTGFVGILILSKTENTQVILIVLAMSSYFAGAAVPLMCQLFEKIKFSTIYGIHSLGTAIAYFSFPFLVLGIGIKSLFLLSTLLNLICSLSVIPYWHKASKVIFENESFLLLHKFPAVSSVLLGITSMASQAIWLQHISIAHSGAGILFYLFFGCYLLGLGIGALVIKSIRLSLLLSGCSVLFFAPILSWIVLKKSIELNLAFVFLSSIAIGLPLPALLRNYKGKNQIIIYFLNFLGTSIGAYLFGFVAPEILSSENLAAIVFFTSIAMIFFFNRISMKTGSMIIISSVLLYKVAGNMSQGKYERLQWKTQRSESFKQIYETRYGVITLDRHDRVFANGAFTGSFDIRPGNFKNRIYRSYIIQSLLSKPSHVLMIGLGSGSWAASIAKNPLVEKLDVIELNPAFAALAKMDSTNRTLLSTDRVQIHYADARNWLRKSKVKYDLVIMNTTFHWQLNISHLLSLEFINLVERVLKPDGYYAFNTTDSLHAMKSAIEKFNHYHRVANFLVVSRQPIKFSKEKIEPNLHEEIQSLRLRKIINSFVQDSKDANGFESEKSLRAELIDIEPVLDDKPYTEFNDPKAIFQQVFFVGGY